MSVPGPVTSTDNLGAVANAAPASQNRSGKSVKIDATSGNVSDTNRSASQLSELGGGTLISLIVVNMSN